MNRGDSGTRARSKWRQPEAFINIPYDQTYEDLYLAFIAGLSAFGMVPRATIEIPTSRNRLDKIVRLIRSCRYSFHDLSRVELDTSPPPTPRFNMPFELGLAVSWSKQASAPHKWFVLEEKPYRLNKSLSDLNGTDPQIHHGSAGEVLRALLNVFARKRQNPSLQQLRDVYDDLKKAAKSIKADLDGGSLFEAHPFRQLVSLAAGFSRDRIASRK